MGVVVLFHLTELFFVQKAIKKKVSSLSSVVFEKQILVFLYSFTLKRKM